MNSNILNNIISFFKHRYTYHAILWVLILFFLLFNQDYSLGIGFVLVNQLIKFSILVGVFYTNLNYLMSLYFKKKQWLFYAFSLIVIVFSLSALEIILLYYRYGMLSSNLSISFRDDLIANQWYIFLLNLIFAMVGTMSAIVFDWIAHQRDRQILETQKMQSELNFLRSQVNPHFLFNTLNSLYALTLKKSDDAPDMVLKLSEMMRYMLYECNEKLVPLEKEINYIKNYLGLEKIRNANKGRITFELEGEPRNLQIAPLLFIPYLENAFKHGLNSQIIDGYMDSVLIIEEESIIFHVENSKAPSMPSLSGKKSGGIGLKNVRRRLDLIYPNKYELIIKDTPNAYIVDFMLQLK